MVIEWMIIQVLFWGYNIGRLSVRYTIWHDCWFRFPDCNQNVERRQPKITTANPGKYWLHSKVSSNASIRSDSLGEMSGGGQRRKGLLPGEEAASPFGSVLRICFDIAAWLGIGRAVYLHAKDAQRRERSSQGFGYLFWLFTSKNEYGPRLLS